MNFKKDCTLVPPPASLNKSFKAIFFLILSMFTFFSCDGNVLGFHGDVIIQVYDNTTEEEIVKRTTIASDHGCIIAKVPENAPIEAELTFEFSIDINGTTYTENLSKGQVLVINSIPAGKIYSVRCTAKFPSGAVYAAGTAEANVMAGKISKLDLVLRRVSEDSNPGPLLTNVTVTFNSNGGSPVDPQTFTRGGKATRPADPEREDYIFVGWYENQTAGTEFDFNTAIYEDTTVYARWVDAGGFQGTAYAEMPAGTTGTYGTAGVYVKFGDWPQTIKDETVTVYEKASVKVGMFTYYKGDDGSWYAKIKENACQVGYKYTNGEDVARSSADSYKYFKVEPIKWRVLTNNYSGKRLLLAENTLVACAYYDYKDVNRNGTIYPNNYKESRIRAYLNGLSYSVKQSEKVSQTVNSEFNDNGFLQTAFTEILRSSIADTTVDNSAASTTDTDGNLEQATSYYCNNTRDKIFLLSEKEVTTRDYGFGSYISSGVGNKRIRMPTDFSKASGAYQSATAGYGDCWSLRSPRGGGIEYAILSVNADGKANDAISYVSTTNGVCPALCVNP